MAYPLTHPRSPEAARLRTGADSLGKCLRFLITLLADFRTTYMWRLLCPHIAAPWGQAMKVSAAAWSDTWRQQNLCSNAHNCNKEHHYVRDNAAIRSFEQIHELTTNLRHVDPVLESINSAVNY